MHRREFSECVTAVFGPGYGATVVANHVLMQLGGVTAAVALRDGIEPGKVWRALCDDLDVPAAWHWGIPVNGQDAKPR